MWNKGGVMRSMYRAAFLGFLISGTIINPVFAAGEVLVPTDAANLGLQPTAQPSTAPETKQEAGSLPYTPAPQTPSTLSDVPATPPSPGSTPAVVALPGMATMVVKMPDPTEAEKNAASLPHSINISINSVWGPAFLKLVNNQLDIAEAQITSQCIISASGFIQTDKGMHMFDTRTTGTTVGKYDGKISGMTSVIRALCIPPSVLPEKKGTIFQVDDKYAVTLSAVHCSASNSSPMPGSAIINVHSSGLAQCDLQ